MAINNIIISTKHRYHLQIKKKFVTFSLYICIICIKGFVIFLIKWFWIDRRGSIRGEHQIWLIGLIAISRSGQNWTGLI